MGVEIKTVRVSTLSPVQESLEQAFTNALAGNREGFEHLYFHYQPIFLKRLSRLVDEKETAEELYQDAMMKAWRALSKKQSLLHFEKSLSRSGTNLAIDYLRHKKH